MFTINKQSVRQPCCDFVLTDAYLDCPYKEKKKDRLKKEAKRGDSGMEVGNDSTQIPASDYQKTVINYQNDDECIHGLDSKPW